MKGYYARSGDRQPSSTKFCIGSGTARAFGQWGGSKRKIAMWLLICAGLLVSACDNGSATYRYRLTVDVETPEGLRTGSSVIEIRTDPRAPLQAGGIVSRVRGEAVAVDLGPRGRLFALLSSRTDPENATRLAQAALQPDLFGKGGNAEAWIERRRALREVRGRADVSISYYPMLVRFRDVRNSLTVEEVQPNNLSRAFGTGVRLARISVEITDEPVSSQLNNVLPWIGDVPEIRLDPQFRSGINPGLPQMLSHGDFKKTD